MFIEDYGTFIELWITRESDYAVDRRGKMKTFPVDMFNEISSREYMNDPNEDYDIVYKKHGRIISFSMFYDEQARNVYRIFNKVKHEICT